MSAVEEVINRELSFVSLDQELLFNRIIDSKAKLLYSSGGGDSGKTFGAGMAAARVAYEIPCSKVYIFKNNLQKCKDLYLPPIYHYFNYLGLSESKTGRNNKSFFCENRTKFELANGSTIQLAVIERGIHPFNKENKHHGMGANLIIIDESTDIPFSWCIEYFLESNRLRRSPGQILPFNNKIVFLENQSRWGWAYEWFGKWMHPKKQIPLDEIWANEEKTLTLKEISEIVRVETWNNALLSNEELSFRKSGGNAQRFFYGTAEGVEDHGMIYPDFKIVDYPMSYNFFYGMDFGTKAYSTVMQVGFGGGYDVFARELWYKQGARHADIMEQVKKIIDHHYALLQAIKIKSGVQNYGFLNEYHLKPILIIDSARSDIRNEINDKFSGLITVRLSDKWSEKKIGIERIKKLNINICKKSKHFQHEIQNYRYKTTEYDNSEVIPDGNDDLLDTYKYIATDILKTLEYQPRLHKFTMRENIHFEMIKTININEITY